MTTYSDWEYTYSADLSDGVTYTGHQIKMSATTVPESVLDEAANAFFAVINNWLPVTSSHKGVAANAQGSWAFIPPEE